MKDHSHTRTNNYNTHTAKQRQSTKDNRRRESGHTTTSQKRKREQQIPALHCNPSSLYLTLSFPSVNTCVTSLSCFSFLLFPYLTLLVFISIVRWVFMQICWLFWRQLYQPADQCKWPSSCTQGCPDQSQDPIPCMQRNQIQHKE